MPDAGSTSRSACNNGPLLAVRISLRVAFGLLLQAFPCWVTVPNFRARFLYIVSPEVPLRSGWNWHPNMLPVSRLEQNSTVPYLDRVVISDSSSGLTTNEWTKYMNSPSRTFS